VGTEYTLPSDGSNLVINRTFIEAIALFGLALFPTSRIFGLDFFIYSRNKRKLQNGKTG
jgi:thiosulfate dehydrogenase [quinone] large subunit